MTDIEELLALPTPEVAAKKSKAEWPAQRITHGDGSMEVTTGREDASMPAGSDRERIFEYWNLNPEEWEIVDGSLLSNVWEAQTAGGGKIVLRQYKARLVPKDRLADVGEVLAAMKAAKPRQRKVPTEGRDGEVFVFAPSDLQIGKGAGAEGAGSQAIVTRTLECAQDALDRVQRLRKNGRKIERMCLALGGDMMEGVQASYSAQSYEIDLGLNQQMIVYTQLLWDLLHTFHDHFEAIDVPSVPSNHTEVRASKGSDLLTEIQDNYDLGVPAMIQIALNQHVDWMDHVQFWFPERQRGHLALPYEGIELGLVHGQQCGRGGQGSSAHKAMKWWIDQLQDQGSPLRECKVLLVGHTHHLNVVRQGSLTVVSLPSADNGSGSFRERSGLHTPPGVASFVLDPHERYPVQDLFVHSA